MRRKPLLCVAVISICVAVVFVAFLSVGRAGGEIGFYATVLSVDGNAITAEVIDDESSRLFNKLPKIIVFDVAISGEYSIETGDVIYGNYLADSINGTTVSVVNLKVITPK